jgi:phospholipid/cholesterol/gamma-HCH transport system permease protein
MASLIIRLNITLKDYVAGVQEFFYLTMRSFYSLVRPPIYVRDIFIQMDVIGVGSLTIIILTGLFTGMVLALQSAYELEAFGAKMYVGRLVAVTMVRELGPVLSALMLAGRVGSGIAAELGSMEVSEQISAMRSMGTDPVRKLVVPRLLACIIMAPILAIIADAFGLFGGYVISITFLGQSSIFYFNAITDAILFVDLFTGLGKPIFFGFVIAMVGCHFGLSTSGGTEGVGRSTTRAVVTASISVLVVDFFLTKLFLTIF